MAETRSDPNAREAESGPVDQSFERNYAMEIIKRPYGREATGNCNISHLDAVKAPVSQPPFGKCL